MHFNLYSILCWNEKKNCKWTLCRKIALLRIFKLILHNISHVHLTQLKKAFIRTVADESIFRTI